MTTAQVNGLSEEARAKLMKGLQGKLQVPAPSIAYRLAIFLVMWAMLLLPVIYLLLIVAAIAGVVWYATHAVGMLTAVRGGRAMLVMLVLYVTPILAGGLLVVFMLRPLVARRAKPQVSITLTRQQEPVLFEFVDRTALLVGAPRPKRICVDYEVNASASFGRCWTSMLSNDLTLTIGVPLAGGLTVAEFAGVLAHEFGHFSQGAGMRVSYIIRTINMWLAIQVHERDTWDESVQGMIHSETHWSVNLLGVLSALMVGITRLAMRALMFIGNLISSMLLRQMEYDADRYHVQTVGVPTFEKTHERIAMMSAAGSAALSTLNDALRGGRLCGDVCALIQDLESSMPKEIGEIIKKSVREEKTGLFDSHPSAKDRIKAGRKLATKGFFHDDRPATVLFSNFQAASRLVTIDLYQQSLGDSFDPSALARAG